MPSGAVVLADEYAGEPGASSVTWAADIAMRKTSTDVVVAGSAYPATSGDREGEGRRPHGRSADVISRFRRPGPGSRSWA